ncbi:HepT-like ribonuclease domain-containing protein [Rhodococcus sp. H-CA8f]|uniref:HepT-like ribonuclease domain-containing protein n=1 Tax=Rhodococcus sp. H-CA8f TaxID=1727214 RepID=UPI0012FFCB95|nr:HepT-like ribonuclease domain-containing protein [Rhodococcus sp. H-CA8f]
MFKTPAPHLSAVVEALVKIRDSRPGSIEALVNDSLLWDGTLMRVQVAGEHLAKIRDQFPEFFREHHDDTWNKLIAMRNIISHAYSEVNPSIMWDVVEYRLDGVRDRIEVILGELR